MNLLEWEMLFSLKTKTKTKEKKKQLNEANVLSIGKFIGDTFYSKYK